jgi:hypothetical protein
MSEPVPIYEPVIDEPHMSYEQVIEYLGDRMGDECQISSHPTYNESDKIAPATLLGLTLPDVTVGGIEAVSQGECDRWLGGHAGLRIVVDTGDGFGGGGLVLTRECFEHAVLSDECSTLMISVFANEDAPPRHPPVGQELGPDELVFVGPQDLVGWGFTFHFSDPPGGGHWAYEG